MKTRTPWRSIGPSVSPVRRRTSASDARSTAVPTRSSARTAGIQVQPHIGEVVDRPELFEQRVDERRVQLLGQAGELRRRDGGGDERAQVLGPGVLALEPRLDLREARPLEA